MENNESRSPFMQIEALLFFWTRVNSGPAEPITRRRYPALSLICFLFLLLPAKLQVAVFDSGSLVIIFKGKLRTRGLIRWGLPGIPDEPINRIIERPLTEEKSDRLCVMQLH